MAHSRANVGRAYVDAFVAWDRLRMCACMHARVDCRDRVVTQTWGLRVRSTTTSDDTVIMYDAAYRDVRCGSVSVSISLASRHALPISLSLSRHKIRVHATFLLSLSLSLHLCVLSSAYFSVLIVIRLVSYFARTANFFLR